MVMFRLWVREDAMTFCTFGRGGLICAAALLVSLAAARAADFHVLHTFCSEYSCPGGLDPSSGLIMDGQGTLYGTLEGEGGTVFSLAADGAYTALYNFCSKQNCTDGEFPLGNLVQDASGNLYGATYVGGSGADCPQSVAECGTVFKVAPGGTETVLYNFCSHKNCTDGAIPNGSLVLDTQGNLYGTTLMGGTGGCEAGIGCGTVFKLGPDGTETVLYQFCSQENCTDGEAPYPGAGLVRDSKGDLFGTTYVGGSGGAGVVFELKPNGREIVLHSFCSQAKCADGAYPDAGLLDGGNGIFWGTTQQGGAHKGGTVFQLASHGGETVLYSFCAGGKPCRDGAGPAAGLIKDSQGNLYGTTASGGGGHDIGDCNGCGVAFKLAPDGTESVLHRFCHSPCDDGAIPQGALVANGSGELFGVTQSAGKADIGGTVFKLKE
jgi:uncharacterized repeat protein (TIGR03803 family)